VRAANAALVLFYQLGPRRMNEGCFQSARLNAQKGQLNRGWSRAVKVVIADGASICFNGRWEQRPSA